MRNELIAALLGDNGKRETLVTWAATLGAIAGTAYTAVRRWWPFESRGMRDHNATAVPSTGS
jgi:hypothetical protein